MKTAIVPACMATLLLTGCGTENLQLDSKQSASLCQQQQVLQNSDVILHKADGSVLSQHQTDNKGHLDLEWPAEAAHLTVGWQQAGQPLLLYSVLNFKGGDAGMFNFLSQSQNLSCGCKQLTLQSADLTSTMPEYQLQYQGPLPQPLASIEICKTAKGQYAPLELLLVPKTTGQGYAATINSDNATAENQLPLRMAHFGIRTEQLNVQSNMPVNEIYSYALDTEGKTHFMMQASSITGQAVQWVSGAQQAQVLSLRRQKNLSLSSSQSVRYQQRHDVAITATERNLSIQLANQESQLATLAPQLFSQWLASESASYNLSTATGYAQVQFILSSQTEGRRFEWKLNGPLQGQLPKLQLPAQYAAALSSQKLSFAVAVQGYANGWDWSQLRAEQAALSRGQLPANDARFLNFREEKVQITLH